MASWWRWWQRERSVCDLVLYTREGCHLCEDALVVLEQVRREIEFSLRVVDIAGDDELEQTYGMEIPVVCVDGKVRFRGRVNAVLLRRLLRAGARDQG